MPFRSGKQMVVDRFGQAVFLDPRGHAVGCGLDLLRRISHGHSQSGPGEHGRIIMPIPDSHHFINSDAIMLRQPIHGIRFGNARGREQRKMWCPDAAMQRVATAP